MQIGARIASKKEPTIALINIVFLMLIFFMIAGTLAPSLDPDLSLIATKDLEGREPPDTLIIHADGHLTLKGRAIDSVSEFVGELSQEQLQNGVRIVPDRSLPGVDLIRIATGLREAGAQKVFIVSERQLQ